MKNQERTNKTEAIGEVMQSSLKIKTSETLDEVELTQSEIDKAMLNAKREKQHREALEAYKQKVTSAPTYVSMNADSLGKYAIKKADELISDYRDEEGFFRKINKLKIDEHSGKIFTQLIYYFSNDERFDGSHEKGLLLQGGVGVGKTLMMKIFSENPHQSYAVISCRKIANIYSEEGDGETIEHGVNRFNGVRKIAVNGNIFGHKTIGYCFDDLGTETIPAKHFGRDKNIMAEVILNRYDTRNISYNMTHITTNLSADEIGSVYGTRFKDRINEMFNIIQFSPESKSRR